MGKLYDLVRGTQFLVPKKKFAIDYQRDAKKALKGRWGIAIVAAIIFAFFCGSGGGVTFNLGGSDTDTDVVVEESVEDVEDVEYVEAVEDVEISDEELITGAVVLVAVTLIVLLAASLIAGPVQVGYDRFNLNLFTGRTAKLDTLFAYFKKGRWGKSARLYLRYSIVMALCAVPLMVGLTFVIAGAALTFSYVEEPLEQEVLIGAVMFIVLGGVIAFFGLISLIVNSYKYCMCFKIFAENDATSPRKAMKKSKELMKGNKWAMFCLHCSFIGWIFLSILTLGIGFIWLTPYMYAADAAFYRNISMRRRLGLN